jgi:chemotaxis protein CheC
MSPAGAAAAPEALERFRAISEAGARNAATALSQLLGRPVRLLVPWARAIPLHQVADAAGGARRVVCGLWVRVYGEARGNLLLVFGQEQVRPLLAAVMGGNAAAKGGEGVSPARGRARGRAGGAGGARSGGAGGTGAGGAGDLTEVERSALREIGNILGAAYLNAVSHLLGLSLLPSIPGLSIDLAGAVTDVLLGDPAPHSDTALVLASQVLEPQTGVRAEIFFLPDAASLPLLGRRGGTAPPAAP